MKSQLYSDIAEFKSEFHGQTANWQEHVLTNICPPCFDFSSLPHDQKVSVSVDGNMQHSRYRDTHKMNFESLPTRLFVNPGQKVFAAKDQGSSTKTHKPFNPTWVSSCNC